MTALNSRRLTRAQARSIHSANDAGAGRVLSGAISSPYRRRKASAISSGNPLK